MNIGPYSFDEYIHLVKSFHGHVAPGMIIGGFMVDKALNNRPEGEFFDALCETASCLPDAVQLLTPCTVGNGWLRIVNVGRYAVTLYEKYGGKGVRVYLDAATLDPWPNIREWFLKLKPKKEQDSKALYEEIRKAGTDICRVQSVHIQPRFIGKHSKGSITICPLCGGSSENTRREASPSVPSAARPTPRKTARSVSAAATRTPIGMWPSSGTRGLRKVPRSRPWRWRTPSGAPLFTT